MALSLGPLRISKRQWKRPWSSDPFGQDDGLDMEKRPFADDDDSDYSSSPSSRATSNSLDPMLKDSTSFSRHTASAYDDRIPRRKFNRYFTLVLSAFIVLFIFSLTRLSQHSQQEVDGHRQPLKPWPYESFPFLKRYHGGVRTLIPRSQNQPEYPGDEEELRQQLMAETNTTDPDPEVVKRQIPDEETKHNLPPMRIIDPVADAGIKVERCPLDPEGKVMVPKLRAFDGCVRGTPENVMGSYDMFGLRNDVCFDRYGRLGPYGLGYGTRFGGTGAGMEGDLEGSEQVWSDEPEVDYGKVVWSEAMARCAMDNRHLFSDDWRASRLHPDHILKINKRALPEKSTPSTQLKSSPVTATPSTVATTSANDASRPEPTPQIERGRTAVVIRTWYDYEYRTEDIIYLRALIAELSLASGMEYVVHFLIHVKNNDLPIWSDEREYQKVLNGSLPEEFRGMGTLWSDKQLELVYPGMDMRHFRDIHLHGSYRSLFMPMQYFAHKHPEYEHFWHWEMDIRYNGHFYDFFDKLGVWAKAQPRKGLWERNARFYVPQVHGTWEDFRQMVRVQTEHGTSSKANMWSAQTESPAHDPSNGGSSSVEKPIWGPEPPADDDIDLSEDPKPPTSYAKDNYEWGVGEDADLITFNPMFDPENTDWNLEKDVTGYNTTARYPPRRTSIISAARLSRRLLLTMHRETSGKKHTMFTEMWPASCALHHGLKAVYAPHPVFIDRRWPTDYLAAVLNAGRNGASGGARTTVFNDANQNQLLGVSWYYHAGFPVNLWRRWLGQSIDNIGGETQELLGEGRMCLPAMLLHPIKHVDLRIEHKDEDVTTG